MEGEKAMENNEIKSIEANDIEAGYKWRRYFARSIDLAIVTLALRMLTDISIHPILYIMITLLLLALVEGLIIYKFGTTLGKKMLNISIKKSNGELNIIDSYKRSFMVLLYGYGLGIPFVGLITMIKSAESLKSNGKTKWDRTLGVDVIHGELSKRRKIQIVVLIIALQFVIPKLV